jgi:ferric-dicitrate binding protein FerR (iron transport regulator)
MSSAERIGWLIYRHTRNELSGKEKKELSAWRSLSAQNESFFQSATSPENLRARIIKTTEARNRIYHTLRQRFPDLPNLPEAPTEGKKRYFSLQNWLIAAAIVVLVFCTGWYLYLTIYPPITAGSYRASVISPDGETEDLSSPLSIFKRGYRDGRRHSREGVKPQSENGNIIYLAPDEPASHKDRYYTLFTKKGEEYILQLADGTRIWLNAATSVKYPANVSQDTIHIVVDGEAYFELAANESHVYVVSTPSVVQRQQSTAAGPAPSHDGLHIAANSARFNVMAYPDEPAATVTLFKGKAVARLNSSVAPSPLPLAEGQQAKDEGGELNVTQAADSSDVIAWKNHRTSFHDAGIQTIMRFVARWYNVEIVYQGKIPDTLYTVNVPHNTGIKELLAPLEKQGVRFGIHGKTIQVIF